MPRYRDDDPDDDIDRDPDERYRRRVERYGEDRTDEEEEEEEKESEEVSAAARKRSLWPGLLMIAAAVLTLLGSAGFVATLATGTGTGPGAGAGAAFTWVSLGICAGIPLLFTLVFCILQLIGGICLVRRRARGMAMTGGILGCLGIVPIIVVGLMGNFPPAVWLALGPALLSIPAGIWMFVAISDTDVQEEFERNKRYG
jgi:hypothetical protein